MPEFPVSIERFTLAEVRAQLDNRQVFRAKKLDVFPLVFEAALP